MSFQVSGFSYKAGSVSRVVQAPNDEYFELMDLRGTLQKCHKAVCNYPDHQQSFPGAAGFRKAQGPLCLTPET